MTSTPGGSAKCSRTGDRRWLVTAPPPRRVLREDASGLGLREILSAGGPDDQAGTEDTSRLHRQPARRAVLARATFHVGRAG